MMAIRLIGSVIPISVDTVPILRMLLRLHSHLAARYLLDPDNTLASVVKSSS